MKNRVCCKEITGGIKGADALYRIQQ